MNERHLADEPPEIKTKVEQVRQLVQEIYLLRYPSTPVICAAGYVCYNMRYFDEAGRSNSITGGMPLDEDLPDYQIVGLLRACLEMNLDVFRDAADAAGGDS